MWYILSLPVPPHQSVGPPVPPLPPEGPEEDCYEEAEPFVQANHITGTTTTVNHIGLIISPLLHLRNWPHPKHNQAVHYCSYASKTPPL